VPVSSPSASSQQWSAAAYAANADFVPALAQPVLDLLQPQRGEQILDLGCGNGTLTEKLVAITRVVNSACRLIPQCSPRLPFFRNDFSSHRLLLYPCASSVPLSECSLPNQRLY
jgi:hypothetical protein